MERTLTNFIRALRLMDVPVSTGEALDTIRTVDVVGYRDRELLKASLRLVVAKSPEEKVIYDDVFDKFFAPPPSHRKGEGGQDGKSQSEDGGEERSSDNAQSEQSNDSGETQASSQGQNRGGSEAQSGGSGSEQGGESQSALERLLELAQPGNEEALAVALQQAAERVQVNDISLFTQRPLYAQRILQELGSRELDDAILDQLRERTEEGEARAQVLMDTRSRLYAAAREVVDQRFELFGEAASEQFRNEVLQDKSLRTLDRRDAERMKNIVRKMAKRLAIKHRRKQKKDNVGRLDLRRTLRANTAFDGIPFDVKWKTKKRDKPKIVTICDVSNSVSAYVQFLLMLLYNLQDVVTDIRSFAFSSRLVDVSDILEANELEEAVGIILREVGMGSTDYGAALTTLYNDHWSTIDRRTTVLILGDGRSNYTNPRLDIFRELDGYAKRIVWLNPEAESQWGTGDSEILKYKPFCSVLERCATVKDLGRAVDEVLLAYQRG